MNKITMPISFTIYTSTSGPLSKTYTLENKGIEKTPSAQMYEGQAERCIIPFKDFPEVLSEATSDQAFGYGLHGEDYTDQVNIVVIGKERPQDNILSRTKKFFNYRRRPGILMLDHDPSEYGSTLTADELIEILISIDPNIAKAARITRGSVSSGVHLTGKKPKNNKGFHIYIPVKDASDIPRYGKLLFKYLWLKGYGYIALASNGALLVRSVIDDAVFGGERIDFVGQPIIINKGIQYTAPQVKYVSGGYLDTSKLPELDDKEARKVKSLIANAKKAIKPDSVLKTAECKNYKIEKIIQKSGISRNEATELVAKIFKGKGKKLWGDWILEFPDGDVTVAELLEDPEAYDGKALADPIEGRTYGKTTAKFWWNDGKPIIHSFAHGQDVSYFLSIKEPKRYIEGVDSYYDHPDYISKEEACEQMKQKVAPWMKNPTGNRANAAPAGIGKTKIVLEHIASAATNKFIEIYVPTHKLGKEVRKTLLGFNPKLKVAVIRGRTFIDKNADAVALCKKSDLISSIQEYGYNIYKDVCIDCVFFDQCEYFEQFDDETQVRIFTHASLSISRGYLDRKFPDMAIIDERFFTIMIDNQTTTLGRIKRYIKNESLADVIIDSLNNKKPLLTKLRRVFGDNVIKVLEKTATLMFPKLPDVTSDTDTNDIKRKFSLGIKKRQILALMLNQLKAEIEKFPRRKNSITVRLVKDNVDIANRHELERFKKNNDEYVPVLCIDADFCPSIAKVFLPGIKRLTLAVERKAHITQIYSTTNAKTRSIPRKSATEGDAESEAAKKHIKDIQGIIDNVYRDYGPTLIVGYQDLVGNPKNAITSKLVIPKGCKSVHFGALRGLNEFQDLETVIVIGRNQLPIDVVEAQAAAIWWDSGRKLVLTGERHYEKRGYRLRDVNKKVGVNVMVCKDKRAQLIQQAQREHESLQAIDRIRLIHNDKPKHVFLLSNVPLDITIDNLVSFKSLVKWKSRIEKALMRAPYGVLVLSSEYLHQEYPELFKNKSMAKNELHATGLGATIDYVLNSKNPIIFNRQEYNLISFRVKGAKGGNRKALAPKKMTRGAINRHLKDILNAQIQLCKTTIVGG